MGLKLSQIWRSMRKVNTTLQALMLAIVILLPGAYAVYASGPQEVRVNDQIIGYAPDRKTVDAIIEEILIAKSEIYGGRKVELADELCFKRAFFVSELMNEAELREVCAQLNYVTSVVAIKVEGKTCVTVKNQEDADWVLEQLKSLYTTPKPEEEIKEVKFIEEVTCEPVKTSIEDIMTPEEALQYILAGKDEAVIHTVEEGDSLWTIARKNNLLVNDILENNPGLEEDDILSIGQEICLTKPVPYISVRVVLEKTTQEEIAFPVEVRKTNEKLRGYQKVIQKGVPGIRKVTYHIIKENDLVIEEEILNEEILEEPVKQIVQQGTRLAVASSRGGSYLEGSGDLPWPLQGAITSGYGYRGREFHPAIDINGNTGDPIRAVKSGKVVAAGWAGNYGKMITIDHGNGMFTRYAHCSSLNVGRGDYVEAGEIIGRVGSTGRSTGSHLHFEIIINGKNVNPLRYLR